MVRLGPRYLRLYSLLLLGRRGPSEIRPSLLPFLIRNFLGTVWGPFSLRWPVPGPRMYPRTRSDPIPSGSSQGFLMVSRLSYLAQ